jgi:hypothetical protein
MTRCNDCRIPMRRDYAHYDRRGLVEVRFKCGKCSATVTMLWPQGMERLRPARAAQEIEEFRQWATRMNALARWHAENQPTVVEEIGMFTFMSGTFKTTSPTKH